MARSRKVESEPQEVFPIDAPTGRAAAWPWLVQFLLPLLCGAGLLGGLLWAGHLARERLRRGGEHAFAFTDVECDPPPGLSRREFLGEAQYLARLPDRLNRHDADTPGRVADALELHPWVARVDRVERLPDGRLRAALAYRVPVLAVAEPARAVDRAGTLLPVAARRDGLPMLTDRVPPPGPPGRPWPDARVKAAARVTHLLGPHLQELGLAGCTVEVRDGQLTLRTAKARVLWGSAPGQEKDGEAGAREKVERLRAAPRLDGQEHDLRPSKGVARRPLGPAGR
jgi:hypothetical protein